MGYWNPERKLGVAGHFLEIIKKAVKYKAMYSVVVVVVFFFFQFEALLSVKNAWLPPIFFLDTNSTC